MEVYGARHRIRMNVKKHIVLNKTLTKNVEHVTLSVQSYEHVKVTYITNTYQDHLSRTEVSQLTEIFSKTEGSVSLSLAPSSLSAPSWRFLISVKTFIRWFRCV